MPEVPADVPLVKDYVPDADDRRVLNVIFMSTVLARPYIAPPNIPADRRQALRDAFMATMKDPDFLAETKKLQLTIDPTSGEEMERIVRDAYALPDTVHVHFSPILGAARRSYGSNLTLFAASPVVSRSPGPPPRLAAPPAPASRSAPATNTSSPPPPARARRCRRDLQPGFLGVGNERLLRHGRVERLAQIATRSPGTPAGA